MLWTVQNDPEIQARDIKVDFILIVGFFKYPFHFMKLSYQALTSTLGDTGMERVVTLLLKQTVR